MNQKIIIYESMYVKITCRIDGANFFKNNKGATKFPDHQALLANNWNRF